MRTWSASAFQPRTFSTAAHSRCSRGVHCCPNPQGSTPTSNVAPAAPPTCGRRQKLTADSRSLFGGSQRNNCAQLLVAQPDPSPQEQADDRWKNVRIEHRTTGAYLCGNGA